MDADRVSDQRARSDAHAHVAWVQPERFCLLFAVVLVVTCSLAPFDFASCSWDELLVRARLVVDQPSPEHWLKLAGHFATFCILGSLVAVVRAPRSRGDYRLLMYGGLLACGILEVLQLMETARHARVADLLVNASGLLVGMHLVGHGMAQQRIATGMCSFMRQRCAWFYGVVAFIVLVLWGWASIAPLRGGVQLDWDPTCRLMLGNETDGSRPWLGELEYVALYGQAWSQPASRVAAAVSGQERQAVIGKQPEPLLGYDFTSLTERRVAPTGSLARRGFALQLPSEVEQARDGGGLLLNTPTAISSEGPDSILSETIADAGEFCVRAVMRPRPASQPDEPRLVTYSKGIWSRNFSLLQEDSDLVFRVRNGANGTNGMVHALRVRGVVDPSRQDIVAVYDHGVSFLLKDGLTVGSVVDLREPFAYLGLGTGMVGRGAGALLLTVGAGLPLAAMWGAAKCRRGTPLVAALATLGLSAMPYALVCLFLGGPWRWSLLGWCAGLILIAFPVSWLYVTQRPG